jgi:murein DD-endopeptidase MepM/ murein hydrolase activator NlpD
MREKEGWGGDRDGGSADFTRPEEPLFLHSVLRPVHRFLPVKITAAVAVVLLASLLYRGDYPWGRPIIDALRYAACRNLDWSAVQEVIPAFRAAWENWDLPSFQPGKDQKQPESLKLPLDGSLTAGFGLREQEQMHYGIELAAPAGTPVKAVLPGRVSAITREKGIVTVMVDHDRGWQTLYLGLAVTELKEGDPVARGGLLGLLGPASFSGASHLYFELRWGGRPVAPPEQWVAQFRERPL